MALPRPQRALATVSALAVLVAFLLARSAGGSELQIVVEGAPLVPGKAMTVRTQAPGDATRGLYVRLERLVAGRWEGQFDLAPATKETGPAHAQPVVADDAGGRPRAFPADGAQVVRLPDFAPPGRYRLRQRVRLADGRATDVYAPLTITNPA